jgi:hypothetical protein
VIHHALDDFYWGSSYREPGLLENVRKDCKPILSQGGTVFFERVDRQL